MVALAVKFNQDTLIVHRCIEIGLFLATMAMRATTAGVAGGSPPPQLPNRSGHHSPEHAMYASAANAKNQPRLTLLRGTRPVKVKYIPLLFSDLHTRGLGHINRGLIPSLHLSSD